MKKYLTNRNFGVLALIFISSFISKTDPRFAVDEKIAQALASPFLAVLIAIVLIPVVWIFTRKKTNPERYTIALIIVFILMTIGNFVGK